MSKIAISPNVSGTGTFTIAAPDSNTDRTLTLPDAGGSVVLNEGSGTFKIESSGRVDLVAPNNELVRLQNTTAGGGAGYISFYETGGTRVAWIGNSSANNTNLQIANESATGYTSFRTNDTERMQINASGSITTPYQPAIFLDGKNGSPVNFTANQQFLTSANYTTVSTRGGMSWDGGTARVTVPTTGFYMLSFSRYEVGSSGRVQIRKNGAAGGGVPLVQSNISGTAHMTVIVSMSAGDYIDIVADAFDLPQSFMGAAHTNFSLSLMGQGKRP